MNRLNRQSNPFSIVSLSFRRTAMKTRIVLMVLAALSWSVFAQAGPMVYNANEEFSLASNPNGVWTYGMYQTLSVWPNAPILAPSTFTAFDTPVTNVAPFYAAPQQWQRAGADPDPRVEYNPTSSTIVLEWGGVQFAPHQIAISTYSGSSTVVRWTAPTAGTVDWQAAMDSIQQTDRGNYWSIGAVFHNDTLLQSTGHLAILTPESLSGSGIAVAAGDHIDFVAYGLDMTGLFASVTLTAVPEPGTIVLLCSGLVGLLCYAWRKRKCVPS
jgi:hypothetical protein